MNCIYCHAVNSESDHRCRRCGRRLTGSAVSAPPEYTSSGATALALEKPAPRQTASEERRRKPSQSSLFADEAAPRVIPFDAQQRESLLKSAQDKRQSDSVLDETSEISRPVRNSVKVPPRKQAASDPQGEQSTLDFLPPSAPQASRTLKTTVEAVIYCDAPVASPAHRGIAALLDGSMIFLGLGIFLVIFEVFGGPFSWSRQNIMVWMGAAGLISMLYGFVWALCGRETAGMNWTELRLINFNGFAPDGKTRALRLIGCWLSYCSGLIGILWALVDEESLTWHDHMSKTFPTVKESGATLFRQRK